MMDIKELERLAPTADEMLSGLHADETMKRRILSAAREEKKRSVSMPRLVPALCCAALAVACIGMFAPRLSQTAVSAAASPAPVSIDTIAAGDEQAVSMTRMADVSGTARVRAAGGSSDSLFASTSGDIPLVAVNGAVYRMLSTPTNVESSLLGDAVGTVSTTTDEPSLADDNAMAGGLSNVAEAGQTIYAVSGVDVNTAVACEVGGNMRLFQRVSYAGKGPGGQGLEDTFSVRGQVAELDALRRGHTDRRRGKRRGGCAARPRDAQVGRFVRQEADSDRHTHQRSETPARRFRRYRQRLRQMELPGVLRGV